MRKRDAVQHSKYKTMYAFTPVFAHAPAEVPRGTFQTPSRLIFINSSCFYLIVPLLPQASLMHRDARLHHIFCFSGRLVDSSQQLVLAAPVQILHA